MISDKEIKNFNPRFSIASCFCEHKGRIVLLLRHAGKSQGLRWGVPAGKMKKNEKPEEAVLREIKEETDINLKKDGIRYFGKFYIRYPEYDYIYYIFHANLSGSEIKINVSEHMSFAWVTPEEALKLRLVKDLGASIRLFYKIKD
jgi:8-oxo-dGTP pyrophosphatase MutT (NUDIX family)